VREARNALPADPGLVEFGERFALAPAAWSVDDGTRTRLRGSGQLELKIRASHSTYDVGAWRRRLGEIEGRVCRIEFPPAVAQGTGFLVGPSAVLTNYHVVKRIIEGELSPATVRLRFDYKVGDDGVSVSNGTPYELGDDWLIDHAPYSERDNDVAPVDDPAPDELDYALLRVSGTPAADPVGGETRPHIRLRASGSSCHSPSTTSSESGRCTSCSTPTASQCRSRSIPTPSSASTLVRALR
jgi:hypothetical protein